MNRTTPVAPRSSLCKENRCCLPYQQDRAEMIAGLEGVLRQLPAERPAPAPPVTYTDASLLIDAEKTGFLREAALNAGLGLDEFVLAGFCGLLSRLTWQESVYVVWFDTAVCLITTAWEADTTFLQGALAMRGERLTATDAPSYEAVGYQFRKAREEAFQNRALDLQLTVVDSGNGLACTLSSASGRWTENTLTGWLHALRVLLCSAAENPDVPLKHISLLEEACLRQVYAEWNQTSVTYPDDLLAHELVTRQAQLTPESTAVVFGEKQLTYRELDEQSTRLARQLIALGAGPNRPVAVCMERSENLPLALLSILKSGSCYVPLDSHHPRQRLEMILEECRPVAVLTDAKAAALVENVQAPSLRMDEPIADDPREIEIARVAPDHLAYIIYTSGTTGRPKGVMITHRSLSNLLRSIQREPGIHAGDRMLAIATISFDIATMDMFLPLVSGATLIVADRNAGGDPFLLADLVQQHDATILQATPFTWSLLASSGWTGKPGLKMIAGGEALPRDLANELIDLGGELWNCYGPTETTIYSSVVRIHKEEGIIPVGPPLANTTFYLIDEGGHLLPRGVPGELVIGGMGVSPGYLLRPELTAERFVPDTFSGEQGKTLFRTGDLARLLSTGELEFMGRLDHQVKLRGFRIELGEIESIFRTHPGVDNTAVILREDVPGEPRLVAYVTLNEQRPKIRELSQYVARSLPEYMVPARIVSMEAMPLTGSGKVDRRALPVPESLPGQDTEALSAAAGVLPANDLEAQLLDIFRKVLGNPSIGVTDNFFDYGGYSLLTARLFALIHRTLGVRLPISLLFDAPTPRALAGIIQSGAKLPVIVPIRTKGRATPLFVVHSYLLYSALPEALEDGRPIYGIRELEDENHMETLEDRAALYVKEIQAAYPYGPLSLAGWCAAASITVEVARLLREKGRTVTTVALFDAECPGYKPELPGGRSFWKAKLTSSIRFHSGRLRALSLREKADYLYQEIAHRWTERVEIFSTNHRRVFRSMQQHTPWLIPERLRTYNAGLGGESLRPSTQQVYPGRLVLVRAADVAQVDGADPAFGWGAVATEGVDVEFAPGNHESMFKQPHLQQFGRILQRVLQNAET